MPAKISKGTVVQQLPVTPMVDLVFNLLLFFIVVTRFAEEDREMGMVLPVASDAQPLSVVPDSVIINLDHEGRYAWGERTMTLPELERALRQAAANNPGRTTVVIRADERCPWKYVTAAMNACSQARIDDYRVSTRER